MWRSHRGRAPLLAALTTVAVAGCGAATSGAPAAAPAPRPPAFRVTVSAGSGGDVETWTSVAGARSYVLSRTGSRTVTVPAARHSLVWPDERPTDLTTVTVAPQRFTVQALSARHHVLSTTSYVQSCPPLVYLAARGSGQNGIGSAAFAAGLGDRGAAVLADLRTDLGRDESSLPALAVDYPAVGVDLGANLLAMAAFLRAYGDSVTAGVHEAVAVLTRTAGACRGSRFVLFGYSQGAQVIGSAYAALPAAVRDRVAQVILFADAAYRPGDPRVRYLPASLSGEGILGARPAFPAGGPAVIQSWCWSDDVVCQRPPDGTQFHGSVYDGYAVQAARLAASELR